MPWLSSKFVALGRALLPARQEQADSSQDDPVLPSLPRQKPDTDDAREVAIEAIREEIRREATRRARARRSSVGIGSPMRNN